MAKGSKSGFTLTEVLVVIGIIVLLIFIAVPALGLLTGSRSIDRAENNLSAMLGRARADAIGLQKDSGVWFFIDPASQLVTCAQVQSVGGPSGGPVVETYLDLIPDRDFVQLPKGVMLQVIDSADAPGGIRADDGYMGFNTAAAQGNPPAIQYGGVILFDATGKLVSRTYAFRGNVGATTDRTAIMHLLLDKSITSTTTGNALDIIPHPIDTAPTPDVALHRSAFGVVLIDGDAFANNGGNDDSQATGAAITAGERGEEQWIDENSVPLLINRYNGTLIRGE